jgi:hypothetical protein
MKKYILLHILILVAYCTFAQWQEITQYGPVKDFLYIDSNLQYIWGDTNYIVENGQARMVADFGFNKKNGYIYTYKQADFIKGTRIGFMSKRIGSDLGSLDVYRTIDGGKSWNKFAYYNFPDYYIWVMPVAIDSGTVLFEGLFQDLKNPNNTGALPFIKIQNNNKIEMINSKVEVNGNWVTIPGINYLYFFDSLYGLGILGPSSYIDNSSIVITKNGGRNYQILDSSFFNKHWGEIIPINKKVLLLLEEYNISISNDSGRTWKIMNNIKYIDDNTDTLFTMATVINEQLFYLRENLYFNFKNPTISILYHKKLMDTFTDSVIMKPSQIIDCYNNNRCYMYNTTFYQNLFPVDHPLSDKENIIRDVNKPKIIYYPDHLELDIPSSAQNEKYQITLFDMSGKQIFTEIIPYQTAKFELKLDENLTQGVYILNLKSTSHAYSLKIFSY